MRLMIFPLRVFGRSAVITTSKRPWSGSTSQASATIRARFDGRALFPVFSRFGVVALASDGVTTTPVTVTGTSAAGASFYGTWNGSLWMAVGGDRQARLDAGELPDFLPETAEVRRRPECDRTRAGGRDVEGDGVDAGVGLAVAARGHVEGEGVAARAQVDAADLDPGQEPDARGGADQITTGRRSPGEDAECEQARQGTAEQADDERNQCADDNNGEAEQLWFLW